MRPGARGWELKVSFVGADEERDEVKVEENDEPVSFISRTNTAQINTLLDLHLDTSIVAELPPTDHHN